jgi:cytochrome c oxidase subunit 3
MSTAIEVAVVDAGLAEGRADSYARAKLGMWLFLFSEVLFFAGLFLLYFSYRIEYFQAFHQAASAEMQVLKGTLNTFVLLTSSATMALAVTAMQQGKIRWSVRFQVATLLLGAAFLAIKYLEWKADFVHGFYPGSPGLLDKGHGEILFCSLYFIMTGIHGLHVLVGACAIGTTTARSLNGKITPEDFVGLENTGLFWHLVDVIWIFLWPLLYLIQ